ncbi:MAG: hypothetical protein MJZ23_02100 [Paludibacteraceae bacterium]|nr:hypothetical protein [Paludibacteraceae bacterium]
MSIKNLIKECFADSLCKNSNFRGIKYFHPSGRIMPNGCHYQRGGFLKECKENKNMFIIDGISRSSQNDKTKYRGGIIVFATDSCDNDIDSKMVQVISSLADKWNLMSINDSIDLDSKAGANCTGTYSTGHFFRGRYVGKNGETYNGDSVCVTVNGLSSCNLLTLAGKMTMSLKHPVLVKDLNSDKIYLADDVN